MSDIRIKMAKDLRDMSDMVGDLHWMAAKAVEDLTKKEGEIAKRDETIARLEPQLNRAIQANYDLREELAACRVAVENCEVFRTRIAELESRIVWLECEAQVNAVPVSEAKAQGVVQWPDADEIMQMAFEEGQPADDASGYCFELEEFDLFIERLMSEVARLNATHVQQPKCKTCDDNGRIGGPSFYAPDEGGEPCPDCSAPVQQVIVPDEMRSLAQRLREYNQNPHHINPMSEAFHILVADAANALSTACVPKEIEAAITWSEHLLFECGALTSTRAPSVHVYNKTFAAVNEARAMIAAAPAAPAADAGLVAAEWAKDAEEWGPALNEAGWLFLSELNEDPQKSALIFNNTKGPLRAAIMKYAEIVAANAKDSSHE